MDPLELSKNSGCFGRVCPCGMWVNCLHYIDETTQDWKNIHGIDFFDEIHLYYDVVFRSGASMPEVVPNG